MRSSLPQFEAWQCSHVSMGMLCRYWCHHAQGYRGCLLSYHLTCNIAINHFIYIYITIISFTIRAIHQYWTHHRLLATTPVCISVSTLLCMKSTPFWSNVTFTECICTSCQRTCRSCSSYNSTSIYYIITPTINPTTCKCRSAGPFKIMTFIPLNKVSQHFFLNHLSRSSPAKSSTPIAYHCVHSSEYINPVSSQLTKKLPALPIAWHPGHWSHFTGVPVSLFLFFLL